MHAWWISVSLVDGCMLDGHVHTWWMGAYLWMSVCMVDECMLDGHVHFWWMGACFGG